MRNPTTSIWQELLKTLKVIFFIRREAFNLRCQNSAIRNVFCQNSAKIHFLAKVKTDAGKMLLRELEDERNALRQKTEDKPE